MVNNFFSLSDCGAGILTLKTDNWMQPFGDRYAPGYSSKGHDLIDIPVYP